MESAGLSGLILKRLASGLVTLFIVSLMVFAGTEILPGDVAHAILGQQATPDSVQAIRDELGLDRPAILRYLEWLYNFVQGDLGVSLISGREITDLIDTRLRNSFFLASVAAVIAIPFAVGLGLVAALYEDRLADKSITIMTLVFVSLPDFLLGYLLLLVGAVTLGWFPALSRISSSMSFIEQLQAVALPCLTLVLVVSAHTMRLTRAAVLSVMNQAYIEMAELKGAGRRRIILRHALPNALSPVLNIVMLTLAYLIVGVVVVEAVFNYSGMGQLMIDAVSKRDMPLVQACGLIFASVYVLLNLSADILSILTNPRRRRPK
ncbi:ABC transporter permease [Cochlodiniinecator piscidefendens]|uniref:ABC transporter permease n=1 Tax=Cochlodiniinecator piscidefendens TaxID=2715756 RepID=UPI00140BAF19|nr:ABC transporter permease [Cochlodiniinecator piscidefendens]